MLTDKEFVKEIKEMYINTKYNAKILRSMLRDYFCCGNRAEKIINKIEEL